MHGVYSVNRFSEIMTRGECVIAVSRSVRDYIAASFPSTDMHRVRVVHRGVDARAFPPGHAPAATWLEQWRRQFPELEGKYVLTLPGRLSRLKGHATFLRLMERLATHDEAVHGLVVGDTDASGDAYARALRRDVQRRALPVTFTGHRDDMRDVYASSDLVLSLSSHPESFGRTVAEALSMGVPVVGYDHGGVGELLASAFPEGRVPVGDEGALYDRVCALRQRPQRPATPLAFSLEAMLERTLAIYQELAVAPAHPR